MEHKTNRGFSCIGLHMPKTGYNIGSALRAASCYDVSIVAKTGNRYRDSSTDTTKGYKHIPFIQTDDLFSVIPRDCVPVAVEFIEDSTSIINYVHPERAFYIFGPEDGSIRKDIIERCRDTIYIPTKVCMNLAATVNVVLYDRMAKQMHKEITQENFRKILR